MNVVYGVLILVLLFCALYMTNGPWCKKCRKRFRLSKLQRTSKSVCTDSAVHIAMLGNAHYETEYRCPHCGERYVMHEIVEK